MSFDPYHKWLQIPPAAQPPNHYRLLGLELFESDREVIAAAADQRMEFVKQQALGPYAKESQQILNELAKARVVLLDEAKKQRYDETLRPQAAPAAVDSPEEPLEWAEVPPISTKPRSKRKPKEAPPPPSFSLGGLLTEVMTRPLVMVGLIIGLPLMAFIAYEVSLQPDPDAVPDNPPQPTGLQSPIPSIDLPEHPLDGTHSVEGSEPPFPSPTSTAEPDVLTNSLGMQLKLIPSGEFLMGSPLDEPDRGTDEGDQGPHRVRITKPFYMGIHEVTKGQFAAFVRDQRYRTQAERDGGGAHGWNESKWVFEGPDPKYSWKHTGFPYEDDHPVVNVSWNDAVAFCEWLKKKEGRTYRLPTEAEWEYACRAGTKTAYQHGDDPEGLALVGNIADATFNRKKLNGYDYGINADDGYVFTAPVGKFEANDFGLHDLHGNAYEWCEDFYDSNFYSTPAAWRPDPVKRGASVSHVLRGGSWRLRASSARSADRFEDTPEVPFNCGLGFRVVAE